MSLTVQHLNADTSFLLTFKPPWAPNDLRLKFPGSFTILIGGSFIASPLWASLISSPLDPWLNGPSSIFHRKFATSHHSMPAAIGSLREIQEELDLIIISQDKPDHCHKATICSLPRDLQAKIIAVPKAADKIRDWGHFKNSNIIQDLHIYNSARPETILRIPIDAYSSTSAEGEVTIANIATKADLTRLHNAVAITYCPPGTSIMSRETDAGSVPDVPMLSRPHTAQTLPRRMPSRPSIRLVNNVSKAQTFGPSRLTHSNNSSWSESDPTRAPSLTGSEDALFPSRHRNYEKVISVLYSPHGVDASLLQPYMDNHLSLLHNALPITVLFHALNVESNPKLLGGIVSTGAPGGVDIVKEAGAKYWVSAHDEVKDTSGWATKFISTRVYTVGEVTNMLRRMAEITGGHGRKTVVEVIASGATKTFKGG
jgi:hypothetical protein